jgi:hypothetical protein
LFEHGDYATAADGSAIRCGRGWRTPEAFFLIGNSYARMKKLSVRRRSQ